MKRFILTLLSTILLTISFCSCTISKPAEPERNITVTGTGSVLVKPDLVSLVFTVKTSEWVASKAVERNATLTTAVNDALKNNGVLESDLSTMDYSVYQETIQPNTGKYTVRNSINVIIRNTENTGKIIDSVITNGSTSLSSYEYMVTDKQTALRQARTLAIQNAQDAANLLAGASGCKVNRVMNICENYTSTSNERGMLKSVAFNDSAVETPIVAGSVSISSTVTITYSLE